MDTTEPKNDYSIALNFNEYSSIYAFLIDYENWVAYKATQKEKKENDLRGKHTKLFHEKARELQAEHPELTYKECLKQARSKQ